MLDASLFYCSAGKEPLEKDTEGRGRQVVPGGFKRAVPSGFLSQVAASAESNECPEGRWQSCASGQGTGRGGEAAWREAGKERRREAQVAQESRGLRGWV